MVLLAVRISRAYDELKGMWEALREECAAMIVYQHDADEETSRTHVHAVIQDLSIGVETIKYRVKSYLKTKVFSKSDWCFQTEVGRPKSEVTWDYITYMSKGKLEPVLVHNVTDNDIQLYTTNWIPDKGKGHKVYKTIHEETPDQKRKRQIDFVKECVEEVNKLPQGKFVNSFSERVVLVLKRKIIEHDMVVGRYKLRDYFDAVMMRCPEATTFHDRLVGLVGFREQNNLYE